MAKKTFFSLIFLCICLYSFAQTYTLQDKWVSCANGVQLLDPYYSDGVSFTWSGSSKNGKAHGFGTAIRYINGEFHSKYEGNYTNGIREGKGTYTHKTGDVYVGTFVNGQLTGKTHVEFENGDIYDGECINYQSHGNGIYKFANGSTFEGFIISGSNSPYTGKLTSYTGEVFYIQKGELVDKITESNIRYSPKIGQRVTEYFDADWNRCEPKQAAYYRLITYSAPNKPKGVVKDYYITGELQSEQYPIFIDYSDEDKTFFEGEQIFYHKNGKQLLKRYYYNNKLNGLSESYYPDGKIESQTRYNMGVLHGDMIGYDESGNPKVVAKYEKGQLHNNKFLQIADDGSTFLIYNEDFERNKEKWEYTGQNGIVQVNDDETISLQANPGRTVTGGIFTGFAPMSENVISIVTNQRMPNKGTVMLLFGFKDWDNYCAAAIQGGRYQLIYVKNGVLVQGKESKFSSAIKSDINQIQIINAGENITLVINDEPVEQIGRIYYDGSLCGVSLVNDSNEPIVIDAAQLVVQEMIDPNKIPQEYLPDPENNGDGWKGNGTGFFLSENGYIATNYHVVDGATAIEVTFTRNGKTESHPATVVVSDKQNDLSIIKIDDSSYSKMQTLPYGLLTRLKDTGSEVFTLGYPIADDMGTEVKFTDGKISSKSGIQGDITVYQITVPIQPGNSGGPLFDMSGNVVGITSSGLNRDYFKSENVNYAIKASYLKNLIDVCPADISIKENDIVQSSSISLTDRIHQYEDFVVLIKVK